MYVLGKVWHAARTVSATGSSKTTPAKERQEARIEIGGAVPRIKSTRESPSVEAVTLTRGAGAFAMAMACGPLLVPKRSPARRPPLSCFCHAKLGAHRATLKARGAMSWRIRGQMSAIEQYQRSARLLRRLASARASLALVMLTMFERRPSGIAMRHMLGKRWSCTRCGVKLSTELPEASAGWCAAG